MAGWINQSDLEIEEIIRGFYDDIYKYCYWKTKNSTDAQDITQETFLRFIQNFINYVDMGKPKALLYTIARNLCVNWQRKPTYIPLENIENDSSFIASNGMDSIIDKLYLHDAVSLLPSAQQEVLLLRYGQGLQVGEIASVLSVSRFTVMYRLKCAINKLKKMKIGED